MENRFYPVSGYELKKWKKNLGIAVDSLILGSNIHSKIGAMEQMMGMIPASREALPVEFGGKTKGDLVEELGIDWTFDYALPQDWVNDVEEKTDQNPCPHIIWSYKQGSGPHGEPFPLTEKGKAILYDYMMATQ